MAGCLPFFVSFRLPWIYVRDIFWRTQRKRKLPAKKKVPYNNETHLVNATQQTSASATLNRPMAGCEDLWCRHNPRISAFLPCFAVYVLDCLLCELFKWAVSVSLQKL